MLKYLISTILISISLWGGVAPTNSNIEKAQKSLFISFDSVGYGDTVLNIPIFDCSNKCEEARRLSTPIDPSYLSKIVDEVGGEFFEKRFDRVSKVGNRFVLKSGGNTFTENFMGPPFPNDFLDFNSYRELVQNYINSSDYQEPLKNLLLKSLPDRLTLKTSKRLSKNLKYKILKKSYLYFVYIDELEGEMRAIQSRKDGGFSLKTDINLILKTVIYKYNPEKEIFTPFLMFDGGSMNIDATDDLKSLYSLNYFDSNYSTFPSNADCAIEFRRELKNSFREAFKEIFEKIEKRDDFRNYSPVIYIKNNRVYFNQIGDKEDLRVDAPIYLKKLMPNSGDMKMVAWGRVKAIKDGNNSMSKAKIIAGSISYGITYATIPYWSGYLWRVSGGAISYDLNHKGHKVASMSSTQLSLGTSIDLGYLFNMKVLSNWLLNISIFAENQDASIDKLSNFSSINFSYLYGYGVEAEYRRFIKGPIYVSGGGGVVGRVAKYDVRYFNQVKGEKAYGNGTLDIISHHLKLSGGLGFALSPNLEIFSELSYSFPIIESSAIKKNGIELDMDYIDDNKFGYGNAFGIKIGINFNYESLSEDFYEIIKHSL